MHKCSSVYSERGVPLPVLTSGGEWLGVRACKIPPASHQVSATSLKLLIQQIHPHVRVERDSGMCVARDLYELWGRSPYIRMFVARTSH
jgi:hypothetical protein